MTLRFFYQTQGRDSTSGSAENNDELSVSLESHEAQISFSLTYDEMQLLFTGTTIPTAKLLSSEPVEVNLTEVSEITYMGIDSAQQSKSNVMVLDNILELFNARNVSLETVLVNEEEIIIQSNIDTFLNPPWENLLRGNIPLRLRREILTNNNPPNRKMNGNILLYLSHACLDVNGDELPKIANDFEKEISSILKALLAERRAQYRKPQEFRVLKYLTRGTAFALKRKSYGLLHLIMHGDEHRGLGFETAKNHWEIDWITHRDFLTLFGDKYLKTLCFLSFCYTAYGTYNKESLSFQMVKNGLTKYAIGFNGTVGSQVTAPNFSALFYEKYFDTNDVEESFDYAIQKLWQAKSQYKKAPILYKAVTI